MSRSAISTLLIATACAAACGGKVVFVEGSGGKTSSGGAGGELWIPTSGVGCLLEPPEGAVQSCDGAVTIAAGGSCVTKRCDAKGNNMTATCEGTSCSCSWNGMTPCVCDESNVDFCAGSVTPCCH